MYTKFSTAAAAVAALAATANGHMIMKTPKPFGGADLDNSPLTSSNFPCKVKGDPATFYKRDGIETTVAVGDTSTLSFTGSAVHGGGSCQLALTKDLAPSASSSWQVILSLEGGCPSKSGQGADTYDFKIPDGIAPGQYVFSWSWISKLAGQPEFYQNCSPLTITGGKSKRAEANETLAIASRDEFPELFVANLADINSCKTTPSTDPEFPNPGPNVERLGSTNNFAKVQGDNCVPKGATSGSGSSSGSGSPDGSGSGSAPPAASSSAAPAPAPSSSAPAAAPPASSGFATSVVPATSSVAAPSSSPAPAASSSSAAAVVPSSTSSAAGAAPTTGSGSSSGAPAGGLSGMCDSEGMFNCVGGTSYQQCAAGAWTKLMQMPAGTKCALGQTMTLWA
ncbi:hypothetical protein SLS62_007089 [Diatrype stigma]|uniref:Uncharacterized protein n=1 Tax=Diatrype stigma TaxID=117547 RepID=A0AAN9UN91_9PEZI